MKIISAAELEQRCLAILDQLGPDGIVITQNDRPVAKLAPLVQEEAASADLVGSLADRIRILGDLLAMGLRWDAEAGN